MLQYLLGTQPLADLARNDDSTEVYGWIKAEDVRMSSVAVSVMSFEIFKSEVDQQIGSDRVIWSKLFDRALQKFELRGSILPVTLNVALQSAELNKLSLEMHDFETGEPVPLDTSNQLVAATALVRHLTLVERRQPYHSEMERMGLSVLDPYAP